MEATGFDLTARDSIKDRSLQRALAMLNATGCRYAVIDYNGDKYGSLEVVDPTPKKYENMFGKGELRSLIAESVGDIEFGGVAFVPCSEDRVERVRCGIHNYFTELFGAGSYTTHRIQDGVEVMRIK